jgi:hypothetical protein
MATFVFVPGAGGVAWYWHRVLPLLERSGARGVPSRPDLEVLDEKFKLGPRAGSNFDTTSQAFRVAQQACLELVPSAGRRLAHARR